MRSLSLGGDVFCYAGGHFRSHFARGWKRYRVKHGISPVYVVVCRPPYFSAVALWDPSMERATVPGHMNIGNGHWNGEWDLQGGNSAGGGSVSTKRAPA